MPFSESLLKQINKKFEPDTNISLRYGKHDLVLITDKDGNAVQMFMGKQNAQGLIKGDRYARTLKYSKDGGLLKDHWEKKGKAT